MKTLRPCLPPRWATTGHAQTILGHLLPSPALKPRGEPVRIPLEDGDTLAGTFFPREGSNTVVHVFHGLGGHSAAAYMQRTARVALDLGHSVLLGNHRGCGDGTGLATGPYHSGRAEDLSRFIAWGRARHPDQRHLAVGFSLSGNALLLLLTGRRGDVPPDGAIAVNAPIHLARSAALLQKGFNRLYDFLFTAECRANVRRKIKDGLLKEPYHIPLNATLADFDAIYTAVAGGFGSRDAYYATCSTKDYLSEIKLPTVLLTAKDDPFVSYTDYAEARLGPRMRLHLENHGGHMGYLTRERTPLGSYRWLDYAIAYYLKHLSQEAP